MEKISLLLLVAKKSLIGSVIVGVLGFGGLTSCYDNSDNDVKPVKIEKRNASGTGRDVNPRG